MKIWKSRSATSVRLHASSPLPSLTPSSNIVPWARKLGDPLRTPAYMLQVPSNVAVGSTNELRAQVNRINARVQAFSANGTSFPLKTIGVGSIGLFPWVAAAALMPLLFGSVHLAMPFFAMAVGTVSILAIITLVAAVVRRVKAVIAARRELAWEKDVLGKFQSELDNMATLSPAEHTLLKQVRWTLDASNMKFWRSFAQGFQPDPNHKTFATTAGDEIPARFALDLTPPIGEIITTPSDESVRLTLSPSGPRHGRRRG
jgi:hypothetical protein